MLVILSFCFIAEAMNNINSNGESRHPSMVSWKSVNVCKVNPLVNTVATVKSLFSLSSTDMKAAFIFGRMEADLFLHLFCYSQEKW